MSATQQPWVDEAALASVVRFYWLTRRQRLALTAVAALVLFMSASVLLASTAPLYSYTGGYIEGEISFTWYRLSILGQPVSVPVLDSVVHLSFVLILGPLLASALTLPSAYYSLRGPRVPRAVLEAAVAGLVVAGLTAALFASFTRLVLVEVVHNIPRGATEPTAYGRLVFAESRAGYTPEGIYALRLALYSVPASLALVAAAALLHLYIQRYYEDILDEPPLRGHHS